MALKLDMSKACDRVEWVWLDKVMEKLGFAVQIRDLIMRCVSTVSYSVKINGTPRGHITPSRGICQGDPLSPYLFLLCAEGLSALIQSAVERGQMEGVKICRAGPKLYHLFFADDSLMFCKATLKECDELQRLLAVYEKASGQSLNCAKTSLFFSSNTSREVQEEIKHWFGAQIIKQHEKYLGLLSLVGKNKRLTFNAIKEKLGKVLAGWKEKLLSKAEKEVLIKAVAQAIPTYTISCFKLPDSLCEEMMGMIRNFWWGQRKDEKKIAWLSWQKMCEPKCTGGLGFKNLILFNKALLAKQGWHLQMGNESLVYRVLKTQYFPTSDFLHASLGHNPSYTWRSLISAQSLVIEARWKTEVLDTLFLPHEAELIKSIPLSATLPADKMVWAATSTEIFTVKSAYQLAVNLLVRSSSETTSDGSSMRKFWKKIWPLPIPHKVRHFCWLACRDTLPTKVKLRKRNVIAEDKCICCHDEVETNGHIFWGCQKAQETWAASKLQLLPSNVHFDSFMDLLWFVMMTNAGTEDKCSQLVTTAWALWCNRNEILYGGEGKTGPAIALWTATYLQAYWSAIDSCLHTTSDPVQPLPDAHQQPLLSVWLPPPTSLFKINVDGALFSSMKQAGIGVVIRDSAGRLKVALCRRIKASLGSLEIEAKAYEAGLLLARHLGLQGVVLEGDSLTISNALKRFTMSPTSVDAIVEGIHVLGAEIGVLNFSHVRRIGNKPAHILARQAQNLVNDVVWIEEIPCCIQQALVQDVSVL